MKKVATILLSALIMLAACSSTSEPNTDSQPIVSVEPPPTVPAVSETTTIVTGPPDSFSPAATVSEAAVIRPQDHVKGAAEPVVAIIEYGDYQ